MDALTKRLDAASDLAVMAETVARRLRSEGTNELQQLAALLEEYADAYWSATAEEEAEWE